LSIYFKLLGQEIEDLNKMSLPSTVENFTYLSQGIVFIVGPKDSGRSTLVASLLNFINKNQNRFIATLEEPIKYRLTEAKGIVEQREIGKDVLSFKDGIDYIKKRNIDVVMLSSCDQPEILEELFALAEAGMLIFTIFDAESSIKTINRIINFFPLERKEAIRQLLADNLGGIISTRLIPKKGGGQRIRAVEILPGSLAVRNLIRENKINRLDSVLELGTDNASSLDHYLADLVSSGEIDIVQGQAFCLNKEKYQALVKR